MLAVLVDVALVSQFKITTLKKYKMKKVISMMVILLTILNVNAQQNFGGAVDKTNIQKVASLKELMDGKTQIDSITLHGKVAEVCKAKGCWMTLKVGEEKMTVKFKDYAFFMPLDCEGKSVTFTGKAFIKEISVAEQKHLAQDAGKSKKEIKKIKKPKKELRFEASGVELTD
jgi:hypothetical protein